MTANASEKDSFVGCKAVLIAPENRQTCGKLHDKYVHYHSLEDAQTGNGVQGNLHAHWPITYNPDSSSSSFKGNW